MRVLFITSRFPGDLRRGDQRRAYEQLRSLSARHAITLLTFDQPGVDPQLRRELHHCCERVITIRTSLVAMLARAVFALTGRVPLQAAMYDAPALRSMLGQLCIETKFDLVHVQLVRMGSVVTRISRLTCVLDFVDALSLNMARRSQYDRGPARWLARLEARRLAAYERVLCDEVKAAAISAPGDRAALGDWSNLHLVCNGVDLAEFPFAAATRDNADIAFVGNLGYFPNVDAATWFATEVMPRVRLANPQSTLNLIGARPASSLRRLASRIDGVRLVGPVAHVHPYLARAAVAVAPMRAGSGQQIKVLEAMAAGTPVVASSLAASGIDAVAGRDLLVADGPSAFADAIARVLANPAMAQQLSHNARALIEQRYTWKASVLALEQLWIDAVSSA